MTILPPWTSPGTSLQQRNLTAAAMLTSAPAAKPACRDIGTGCAHAPAQSVRRGTSDTARVVGVGCVMMSAEAEVALWGVVTLMHCRTAPLIHD